MNRNILTVLLIFLVPLAVYFALSKDKVTTLPSLAADGAEVIKFSSPMCYECQELDKIFEEVYPQYDNMVKLKKVDVTQRNKETETLLKEYDVKLVPTTVFRKDGATLRRIEGSIQPKILENYLKETING